MVLHFSLNSTIMPLICPLILSLIKLNFQDSQLIPKVFKLLESNLLILSNLSHIIIVDLEDFFENQ